METTRYLTVEEVASEMRVSEGTVRRWLRNGLAALQAPGGGVVRIKREDLLTFLTPEASLQEKASAVLRVADVRDRTEARVAEAKTRGETHVELTDLVSEGMEAVEAYQRLGRKKEPKDA